MILFAEPFGSTNHNLPAPDDTIHTWRGTWGNATSGLFVLLFPQGQGRVRAYISYPLVAEFRLSGDAAIPIFIENSVKAGAPADYFATATPVGPLASYPGTHIWVDHPYQHGVALIGDAAATSDPTHGQGLSTTLRDVRLLRDHLLVHEDWEEAGHAYATDHDRYHATVHTAEVWAKDLWHTLGTAAHERRQKVMAAWKADPTRRLDTHMSGPDQPLDEQMRRRYFAEDWDLAAC